MRPHVVFAMGCLVTVGPASSAECPDLFCPITGSVWDIFSDARRGVPEFWGAASLPLTAVHSCEHGIQFLFLSGTGEDARVAALVFPRPTRELLARRLGLDPAGEKLASELEHFVGRYRALGEGLARLSKGSIRVGTPRPFPLAGPAPVLLDPARRLELEWDGETLPLRGYLDVYFQQPVLIAGLPGKSPSEPREEPDVAAEPTRAPRVPRELALAVSPNPGRTTRYLFLVDLPRAGPVELDVFDVGGRRVSRVLVGPQEAGRSRIPWTARDATGERVASGVYFARLATPGARRTMKLVHLGR